MLIQQPENFDEAIAASTRVAEELAAGKSETERTLRGYLTKSAPGLSQMEHYQAIVAALWHFSIGLSELIREKQNSIWSFIIRNSYRPAMLRQQFDLIVGNPPWVAYRYVTDPGYQKEIKRLAVEKYRIAPKSQKLFTQMELATVFLAHALDTFAKPGAQLAFVMPRSVLSADQHQNLIQRTYAAKFRLTGFWDLWNVKPLFNVPCCVLFAEQAERRGFSTDSMPAQAWTAQLTRRDLPWKSVAAKFTVTKAKARVIWLGGRSALSIAPGRKAASRPSPYAKAFRQGATIVPRNLFFVSVEGLKGKAKPDRYYYAKTDEQAALVSKKPWQEVRMQGSIEGCFLYSVAISQHVLPFCLLPPSHAVLPVEALGGSFHTLSYQAMIDSGNRDCAAWMERAQAIWDEKQGVKAKRLSLLQRIDYQKGLTSQSYLNRYLVLYNAAGTNVSATFCDADALDLRLIVEHKLYWGAFAKAEEAHYLAAVLNSHSVNLAIKPFQSTGLLGERDIEKKLLDVPIPRYNPENHIHRTLSKHGAQAHREAKGWVADLAYPASASLARRRSYVRTAVRDTLKAIDELVKPLIGLSGKLKED